MEGRLCGVLSRHVATFRYEDGLFALMAKEAGLLPMWLEYVGDKYVDVSSYKRSLLRPTLCSGRGRNGGLKLRKETLVENEQFWRGKPFQNIVTDHGGQLVAWHHTLQNEMLEGLLVEKPVRTDCTGWLGRIASTAHGYYEAYMSVFVAHGVLFEDYHGGESGNALDNFTGRVFEPAWKRLHERFGVRPLIVRLPWWESLGYYPGDREWRSHGVIPPQFPDLLSGNQE
ncbi:hypothetical protein HY623_00125 [Candidatus Uhrbacteria bacterium]|nr:hypothetical protein [Candidatus Uhrbacteria bacterium]